MGKPTEMDEIIEQVTEYLFVKGKAGIVFRPALGKYVNEFKESILKHPRVRPELDKSDKTGWVVSNLKWEHVCITEHSLVNRLLIDITIHNSNRVFKVVSDIIYNADTKETKIVVQTTTWI